MDFFQLAAQRRSIRKFTAQKVDNDLIQKILTATFTAPSSKNSRSTRIVVVRNGELLEAMSSMRITGSQFIGGAPLAFVVMGDQTVTDLWRENCSISATFLQLAIEESGLGSCWVHVDGRPWKEEGGLVTGTEEYLHNIIAETRPYRILCVVAAGYPEFRPKPHGEKDDSDKVIFL